MAGIIGHETLELRGIKTNKKTTINTDQAGLYPGTPVLVSVDGVDGPAALKAPGIFNLDPKGAFDKPVRLRSQAIYPTKTPNVWFQLHGSTNPWPVLEAIGVDPESGIASADEAYEHIKSKLAQYTARDLEMIMIERGLAGSIVHNPEEWLKTKMGAMLASHPLVNYHKVPWSGNLKPPGFSKPVPGDARPLAGVKVLELARIIAAPACGAALAAMGAEVVRVQTDRLLDFVVSP